MPDSNGEPVDRNFKIAVDQNGKFSYIPPEDWEYGSGDRLTYECNLPFKIAFTQVNTTPAQAQVPAVFGDPLEGVKVEPGVHRTPPVVVPQAPPKPHPVPIVSYRYHITAFATDANGNQVKHHDDSRIGSDIC